MKYVESENISLQEQLSALHDGELSSADAVALVRQSLADESVMLQWRSMSAISAVLREPSNAAMAQPSMVSNEVSARKPVQEAANDGVFRWKMVAGLAAFAAVGSLAWGLLGSAGNKSDVQGGVMAQSQNTPAMNASATNAPGSQASGQASIAAGGQKSIQIDGQEIIMIRDPRLDELLAAHKQFGGSSALQQPAGSLRSVSLGSVRP